LVAFLGAYKVTEIVGNAIVNKVLGSETRKVGGTAKFHQTKWTPNAGGPRTLSEALKIAEKNGVYVADDVRFNVLKDMEYDERFGTGSYATYGRGDVQGDPLLPWKGHMADKDGNVTIHMRESVLDSDESIVAIMEHETFEVEALRDMFTRSGGSLRASEFQKAVSTDIPFNVHWDAVDSGDALVRLMRSKANGGH